MRKQPSKEDLLKESYKDSLTCFLKASSLYDCLSINNMVTVVDQSFSLLDVFRVFLENHIDEVLFWNSDAANYDGVFTHTDLIKVTLKQYNVVTHHQNRGLEIEEPLVLGKLTQEQFIKLMTDFKTITIKQWYNMYGLDLHQSNLIKSDMNENLNDACIKIIRQKVTRIVVIDKESRMITGIIQQKDILAFMVKGFSQYFNLVVGHRSKIMQRETDQHDLEMSYFIEQLRQVNYTVPEQITVYDVFHRLIYVHKRASVPVVNEQNQYVGLIDRRDFLFIIKYQIFDILSQTAGTFLDFLRQEKSKYPIYQILNQEFFTMNQTVKEVVENLVVSSSGSLVCLNQNRNVVCTLHTSDLFTLCLEGD
ncbi:hypothetical protein pb186bvf_001920 [Paramecium bursaria]